MNKTPQFRTALGFSCVFVALTGPGMVTAQTAPAAIPSPSSSTQLPDRLPTETTETSIAADGVETITRTRRIPARTTAAPYEAAPHTGTAYAPPQGYTAQPYAPQGYTPQAYASPVYVAPPTTTPVVYGREQWIEACRQRTAGRSREDRNQIIGSLLGASVGGLAGNRIASGKRLGGTVLGAGAGGLAGAAIGNAIKDKDEAARYDCSAALDNHLSQYTANNGRLASRTIPAGTAYPGAYPVYAPQAYYPQPAPTYQTGQPTQYVWVPVEVEQPQRVIVRETVREEPVPARRVIPTPRQVSVPATSKLVRE